VLVCVVGCHNADDARINAARSRLLLSQEPEGAQSIADVRKRVDAQEAVTVAGEIEMAELDPFVKDRSVFWVREVTSGSHGKGAGHDASTCPFCKRKARNAPRALVQCQDENGQEITMAADRLLGLQKGDIVVIRGQGALDANLDMLTITAKGIYIRP